MNTCTPLAKVNRVRHHNYAVQWQRRILLCETHSTPFCHCFSPLYTDAAFTWWRCISIKAGHYYYSKTCRLWCRMCSWNTETADSGTPAYYHMKNNVNQQWVTRFFIKCAVLTKLKHFSCYFKWIFCYCAFVLENYIQVIRW